MQLFLNNDSELYLIRIDIGDIEKKIRKAIKNNNPLKNSSTLNTELNNLSGNQAGNALVHSLDNL